MQAQAPAEQKGQSYLTNAALQEYVVFQNWDVLEMPDCERNNGSQPTRFQHTSDRKISDGFRSRTK